jgi:hypothetical protein
MALKKKVKNRGYIALRRLSPEQWQILDDLFKDAGLVSTKAVLHCIDRFPVLCKDNSALRRDLSSMTAKYQNAQGALDSFRSFIQSVK